MITEVSQSTVVEIVRVYFCNHDGDRRISLRLSASSGWGTDDLYGLSRSASGMERCLLSVIVPRLVSLRRFTMEL